jgi:hypothetical protein
LSVAHVALVLPWIMAVVAARLPVRDNSFLWHVTAGRVQIEQGAVLTVDPFSFTFLGVPWRTQSWLLELVYGFADKHLQLMFVVPMVMSVATATFAFILAAAFRLTRSVEATALVGVLTAWVSAVFLSPRPVIASYLLMAIVVASCLDRRLRWVLPLVIWVWASVHGSFVLGIGYVALDGLRRKDRAAAISVAAMTAASTLTAHGVGVWEVLVEFTRNQAALDLITEWDTPDLTHVALMPFFFGIVLLIVGAHVRGYGLRDLWVIVPFLGFAFTATRAVFPAWIALAPFVGGALVNVRQASRSEGKTRRILAGLVAALIILPFVIPTGDRSLSETFPVDAARELTRATVFHDDYVGGYLIFSGGPERKVFVDDRAELYGADHLRAMVQTRGGGPGWAATFDEWNVEQALVRWEDGIADVLTAAQWGVVFEDEVWVVFERPVDG